MHRFALALSPESAESTQPIDAEGDGAMLASYTRIVKLGGESTNHLHMHDFITINSKQSIRLYMLMQFMR